MKKKLPKVLMSFKRSYTKLVLTAGTVSASMHDLEIYPLPPVTQADLDNKRTALQEADVAQKQGGPLATALKHDLQADLEEMLVLLALYVQLNCLGLVANVLAAGFEVAGERGPSLPLPKPASFTVDNSMTGKIVIKTAFIKGARCFKAQYALVDADGTVGEWQDGDLHTKCREITVNGLVSGALYALRIQAVGGSTGESEWSNVVSGRCM